MRTPPSSSSFPKINVCAQPSHYSGGRAVPESFTKNRKSKGPSVVQVDAPFGPDFNVIHELKYNRDKYTAGKGETKSLSMLSFPVFCRMNIDRLRSRVTEVSEPGIHPALTACIKHGLDCILNHKSISRLVFLKHRFDLIDSTISGDVASFLYTFFKRFDIDLLGGRRQNVTMPEYVHCGLSTLCSEIGTSIQDLGVMCAMVTLVEQPDTNRDHVDQMQACIDKFVARVDIRITGVEALMAAYGLEVDETDGGSRKGDEPGETGLVTLVTSD